MPDTVGDGLNVYKYYSIFEVLRLNRKPCAKVSRYSKKVCILYVVSAAKPGKDGYFQECSTNTMGSWISLIQHSIFWAKLKKCNDFSTPNRKIVINISTSNVVVECGIKSHLQDHITKTNVRGIYNEEFEQICKIINSWKTLIITD